MDRDEAEAYIQQRWQGSTPQERHIPLNRDGTPDLTWVPTRALIELAEDLGFVQPPRGRGSRGQTRKIVEQIVRHYNGGEMYFRDIVNEARWVDTRITESGVKTALTALRKEGLLSVKKGVVQVPTAKSHDALIYTFADPARPVREYDRAAGLQSPVNRVDLADIENVDLTPGGEW